MILQAPATFAIAIVILAGIIWGAMNWTYSSQVTNLQSRLSLRDDQIADYKTKLEGATPDEAKNRLEALELQVKALSPRRLTEEQKDKIIQSLKGVSGTIEIAQDMGAPDAKAYRGDLALAFQAAGWIVSLPAVLGLGNPPPTGVGLMVGNPAAMQPIELATKRALEAAAIVFDIQQQNRPPRPVMPPSVPALPPQPDIGLVITTKLNESRFACFPDTTVFPLLGSSGGLCAAIFASAASKCSSDSSQSRARAASMKPLCWLFWGRRERVDVINCHFIVGV